MSGISIEASPFAALAEFLRPFQQPPLSLLAFVGGGGFVAERIERLAGEFGRFRGRLFDQEGAWCARS